MEWFEESVRALQIAHAEGVIHGHIEPSNVFVVGGTFTPRSRLKLRGFTDAAWRVGVPGGASHPAEVDALHAAPELEADDPTLLGPWTDVYGVARIFLELLIGRRPPPGLASSAPGLLVAQEIESALDRALAPRPEDRFRALDTFLTTLNRALHDPQDKVRGPSPRRTMVVSEHVTSEVAGSVGSFEVEPEDDTPVAVEPEVDAPRARVRFAHTQRVLASPSPVTLKRAPMVGRTVPVLPPPRAQSPPRAQTPPNGSPGPYESGVYVKNGLHLTRVGSRAWPYALGGVLVALMTVYLLLMLNTR
jgi:hypothetical protein